MKKRYLITGCAGFIGFHLCQKLLEDNSIVIGVDKVSDYYDVQLKYERLKILKKKSNFIFIKKDLNNDQSFKEIKKKIKNKKINTIIHLAAQAGVRNSIYKPLDYIYDNILAHTKVCEFARKENIKKVVYASSSSIYGENKNSQSYNEKLPLKRPLSFYSATKQSVEQISSFYSKYYKIYFVGLRIFTSYGPYGRPDLSVYKLTHDILNKKKVTLLNYGKIKRDFTYVDDTVSGISLAIKFNFKKNNFKNFHTIFNIGSGKSFSIIQLTKLISQILKIKCKIKLTKGHPTDMNLTLSDLTLSKKILKYHPKTSLETGLENFINWYLKFYRK